MRVLAVSNQKGGCGKTTTSINFAACLAFLHKKVLLIDLDPQGHSTCGLGIRAEDFPKNLYQLLSPRSSSKPDLASVLCPIHPDFFLIPTYGNLAALEEDLAMCPDRDKRLKQLLQQEIAPFAFDYVILDCPPNLGVLTFNALDAADEIIIPIEPSFFSLHGLAKMSETIQANDQIRGEPLDVRALLTIFDSRTHFAAEVYEEVKKHFSDRLFKTIIHENVLLKEAASAGQSIVQYDQTSGAFRDYLNMAVEYLEGEWERILPKKSLGWNSVVQSRYGPRRVPGGVLFQVMSQNARWVEIAGDFNNWIPETLVRRNSEGLWQKVIPLHSGHYRYKFIVDGEWQIDPYQPMQQKNEYGSFDSYLELV